MTEKIFFMLNSHECISIELDSSLRDIHCCYSALVYFVKNQERYLISEDVIRENISLLKNQLMKALNNNLLLDFSINNSNIGYLHTKYLFSRYNEVPFNKEELIVKNNIWVGHKYHVWGDGFGGDFTLWIYNNQVGEIILEITPTFTAEYFLPDETPNFDEYERWMENYEPLLKRIIPKEIAQQWLDQTNTILKQIEENIARFEKENTNEI